MKQPETAQAAKSAIREEARRHRDALDLAARASASAAIARHAIALVEKVRPRVMAAYHAIRSEADPRAIIDWAHRSGVACALPAVQDAHTLVFRRYRAGDLLTGGGFGTSAPTNAAEEVDPDLLLVPMLAFDRTGTRLGSGRGFYDRGVSLLLHKGIRPFLIGIAFAAQEMGIIPAEPHDVKMDWIVTEKETLDLRDVAAKG